MEFYPGFEQKPKRKYTKKMTELQKWQAVNKCEDPIQLGELILKYADEDGMIQGRERKFNASHMTIGLNLFMADVMSATVLTREFGIRQQAIYLKTFNK